MNISKLNENISFFRKKIGITQEELANALGVTNQAVSKWESGKCAPDIQLLPDIAEYFNISIDELFGRSVNSDISTKIQSPKETSSKLDTAIDIASKKGYISSSILQFKLKIGCDESRKLIRDMESLGYIKKDEYSSYKYKFISPQEQNKSDIMP